MYSDVTMSLSQKIFLNRLLNTMRHQFGKTLKIGCYQAVGDVRHRPSTAQQHNTSLHTGTGSVLGILKWVGENCF